MKKYLLLPIVLTLLLMLTASCTTSPGQETATQELGGEMESDDRSISSQELTGLWQGILKAGGQELRLVFHFEYTDGTFTATMDSPDQGASGIKVDTVTIDGRTLHAELKAPSAYYEGELNSDATTVTGSWW